MSYRGHRSIRIATWVCYVGTGHRVSDAKGHARVYGLGCKALRARPRVQSPKSEVYGRGSTI
eukprot:3660064-Rhodomonas_salina.1